MSELSVPVHYENHVKQGLYAVQRALVEAIQELRRGALIAAFENAQIALGRLTALQRFIEAGGYLERE